MGFPGDNGAGSFAINNQIDDLARVQIASLNTPLQSPANQIQYAYDQGSERTQQVFKAGNFINYTYDNTMTTSGSSRTPGAGKAMA